MISIIVTVLLIALFIIGIVKKYNVTMMLLTLGLGTLGIYSLITNTSVLGDASAGSKFLDLFELINTTAQKQLSGALLIIMSVMAYVSYMGSIKASDYFAYVVAKPLQKLKAPYILASLTILLGTMLKFAIPSAVSMITLLLATIYPVLRRLGVSRATAASCLMMSGVVVWGPADTLTITVFGLAGVTEPTVPEFFLTNQVPIALIMVAVLCIVFPIVSKFFDKKENVTEEAEQLEVKDGAKEMGLPWIYAIMPLFPLILVVVFSKLVVKTIIMSVVAANFLSLFAAMIIHMICQKNIKKVFNDTQAYFLGMGKFMGTAGFIIVAGAIFATAINKIGGLTNLVTIISNAGGSGFVLTFIASLILFPIVACTGSVTAAMTLFVPLFTDVAVISGTNPLICYTVLLFVAGLATGMTPISASMIVVSEATQVPISTILKRNIIPLIAALVVIVPICFIIF